MYTSFLGALCPSCFRSCSPSWPCAGRLASLREPEQRCQPAKELCHTQQYAPSCTQPNPGLVHARDVRAVPGRDCTRGPCGGAFTLLLRPPWLTPPVPFAGIGASSPPKSIGAHPAPSQWLDILSIYRRDAEKRKHCERHIAQHAMFRARARQVLTYAERSFARSATWASRLCSSSRRRTRQLGCRRDSPLWR